MSVRADVPRGAALTVDAADAGNADDTGGAPRRLGREAAVVATIAGLGYLATLSSVPALSHDSLGYMLSIERGGAALFHPHHMAYNAVARVWLELWSFVGADPLRVVESLNALLGAAATALVWLILRARAGLPRHTAAVATAGACVSYGVWYYSVSVEVYVLSLVCLLGTFLVVTAPAQSARTAAWAGGLLGLSVLAHQVNVAFGIVVVVEIVRRADRSDALRRVAVAGAAAAAVVVAAYSTVLAAVVRPRSVGQATDWFTSYAQEGGYWHVEPSAPAQSAVGLARALVGGQFAYRLESIRSRVHELYPSKSLIDEAYLVRGLSPGLATALIVVTALAALVLVATLVVGLWRRRQVAEPGRSLLRPLLLWVAVYGAFFLVWEPYNPEFHIPQLTVWWMIAGIVVTRTSDEPGRRVGRRVVVLAGAALCVALANGIGTVVPATRTGNDIYALRYGALGDQVAEGDLVIVDHPHLGLGYTTRETAAEALAVTHYRVDVQGDPRQPSLEEIVARAQSTLDAGGRVAIDSYLVDEPSDSVAAWAGAELRRRFGDRWQPLAVPGTRGWYLIVPR